MGYIDQFYRDTHSTRASLGQQKNVVVMNGIAACSPSSCMFLSYPDLKLFTENYNISTNNLQVEVAY